MSPADAPPFVVPPLGSTRAFVAIALAVASCSARLPFHAPWAWIVSVCVAGALLGHLVLLRRLLRPATA